MISLSALALALIAAAYVVAPGAKLGVANASWTIAGVVAALGSATAWRRAARRDRGAWAAMFGAAVIWLLGQALWDLYAATTFPTSPNLADLLWLAFPAFAAAGVYRIGRTACRGHLLVSLELAPLVVAALAVIVALLWEHLHHTALSVPGIVTSFAYPLFYVCAALVMLQTVLAGAIDVRRNAGMAAVLAGLLIEAVAFILWAPMLFDGTYMAGTHAIDALWTVGMLMLGIGAWRADSAVAVPHFEEVTRRRAGVLPALAFVVVSGTQITYVLLGADRAPRLALALGLATVGATLIVRAALLRRQQGELFARLEERERELHEANARLARESRVDPLTGVGNRLRLREDFADLFSRAHRYGQGYCLVLCDLDRFKAYNDALGHQAGDDVLRRVAAILEGGTREGDHIYRYGGEELLLILPEQEIDAGHLVAERHRAAVEAAGAPHPANAPAGVVTLSAGVAVARPGEHPDDVLRRADRALYEAKHLGRNRVTVSPEPLVTAPA